MLDVARELEQGIRQLNLVALARRRVLENAEDLGAQHIAADDRQVGGSRAGGRLLHEARDAHHVVGVGRLDRRHAVQVRLVGVDLQQGHDRRVALLVHLDHPLEQRVALVDEVVAEQNGERLVPDVHLRAQHRVAEPLRVALAHVVHVGEVRGVHDLGEPLLVALDLQRVLELGHPVEVVLERVLVAPGDHEHIGEARVHGLLHDVLDGRLVDDGHHLLRHRLGRGEESRAQACSGNDGFREGGRHGLSVSGAGT